MTKIDLEQDQLSAKDRAMAETFSSAAVPSDHGQDGEESPERVEGKITDPRVLIERFEKTKALKSFMKDRMKNMPAFKGRKRSEISDEEIKEEVEFAHETDGYKNLLMHYFQDEGGNLSYDPSVYSAEFIKELEDYWAFIVYERKESNKYGPAARQENDLERSRRHMRAARQLTADGMSPNDKISRLIVHFLSIDKGYDDLDFYRDENRRAITLQ